MEEKTLTKQQQEIQDAIAWCGKEENYIGLSPLDLWESALTKRDAELAMLRQENERLKQRVAELTKELMFPSGTHKQMISSQLADEHRKVVEKIACWIEDTVRYTDTPKEIAESIRREFLAEGSPNAQS